MRTLAFRCSRVERVRFNNIEYQRRLAKRLGQRLLPPFICTLCRCLALDPIGWNGPHKPPCEELRQSVCRVPARILRRNPSPACKANVPGSSSITMNPAKRRLCDGRRNCGPRTFSLMATILRASSRMMERRLRISTTSSKSMLTAGRNTVR